MFALLFDRKSLTMTLLALGGMGLLLFVSGFALGSYLNGGLEQLGVIAREVAPTTPRESTSRIAAPSPRRSTSRGIRRTPAPATGGPDIIEMEEDPALTEPFAEPPAEGTDERMDETSGPPEDWVPPYDGAAWPGEEPGQEGGAEETFAVETARTQVAETAERTSPGIRTASMKTAAPRRAQGFYYIQLGTFSREEIALETKAMAESRIAARKIENVASFLAPVTDRDGSAAFAVRVGPFPTRGAAREAAAGHGSASVVWWPSGRDL